MATMKSIESSSTTLDALLNQLEQDHATVQVLRDGRPVAEVRPIALPSGWKLPPIDERLKPVITPEYDPVAGVDEEDWPADQR